MDETEEKSTENLEELNHEVNDGVMWRRTVKRNALKVRLRLSRLEEE